MNVEFVAVIKAIGAVPSYHGIRIENSSIGEKSTYLYGHTFMAVFFLLLIEIYI